MDVAEGGHRIRLSVVGVDREAAEAASEKHTDAGTTARVLGCKPAEVIFTSGATEANHLAVRGLRDGSPPERRRIKCGVWGGGPPRWSWKYTPLYEKGIKENQNKPMETTDITFCR